MASAPSYPPRSVRPAIARFGPAAILLACFAVVLVRTAWLCDDAYITFRTVDNLVHGRGATWNPAERVQVYTHPLWMLVVASLHALTGELPRTVLSLSIALSLASAALLVRALGGGAASVVLVLALSLSRAFVDFSTSGLEGPLSHFLLALFLVGFARGKSLLVLAFLAGLATTNRMDTLLVYLPALVVAARGRPLGKALSELALGFVPFFAWEIFALVYYGFPFPNSAYAKLGTGIGAGELARQGLHYLADSALRDPLTLAVALAGFAVPFVLADRRRFLPVALGALLYGMYVVRIGGDFMSGRMLTLPFLACAYLFASALAQSGPRVAAVAAAVILVLGLATPRPTWLSGSDFGLGERVGEKGDGQGVADERRVYYQATGLSSATRTTDVPAHVWAHHVWAYKGLEARASGSALCVRKTIGFFGYCAGPRVHVVDTLALGDPLLARIPRVARSADPSVRDWRPGHFRRELPEGYLETLERGVPAFVSPELARYHAELVLVTRGPLFSAERWRAIAAFLLGRNDALMDAYLASSE